MFERQLIPVYLPSGVFQRLRALKRFFIRPKALPEPEGMINFSGDRELNGLISRLDCRLEAAPCLILAPGMET